MSIFMNIAIGLDQTLNCCIKLSDGWGEPDEMLSARAWRLREKHPWLRAWIDRIFWWGENHCQECFAIEMRRKQLPPEYQEGKINA